MARDPRAPGRTERLRMTQARRLAGVLATTSLLCGTIALAAPAQARTTVNCVASSVADINTCLTGAAAGTDKDITLTLNNNITADQDIAALTLHGTNTLIIDGNLKTLTLSSYRGFDILAASSQTITINNLRTIGGSTSGDGGALLLRGGRLSASNITIQNATANGYGGGIALNDSDVTHTITRSVITGNTATTQSGGGIYAVGAVTLINSTVYNNTAQSAGGLNVSAGSNAAVSSIQFSTISGNSAGNFSSNLDSYAIGTKVRLIGSVLSNPLGTAARNCRGTVLSASYTVIGNAAGDDTSCGATATNQLRLGTTSSIAFASFDTNTNTLVPASNSILVNYAPDALSTGITTDQTGATRSGAFTAGSVQVAMPMVSASPSSGAFGTVTTGSTSSATTFAISNPGSSTLTFGAGAATLSGSNAGDFAIASDTCSSASIPIGATCAIGVTFTPGANGARSASLVLADNAADSPQSISLTGTGGASGGGGGGGSSNNTEPAVPAPTPTASATPSATPIALPAAPVQRTATVVLGFQRGSATLTPLARSRVRGIVDAVPAGATSVRIRVVAVSISADPDRAERALTRERSASAAGSLRSAGLKGSYETLSRTPRGVYRDLNGRALVSVTYTIR